MAIFDELKSIGKILQEAGKIEQYKQILEAQKELLEMEKRIQDLEKENRKLKEKLEIKENLEYDNKNSVYWIKKEGMEKDGPFCSRCWDVDKKLVRLHPTAIEGSLACPQCKKWAGSRKNYPHASSSDEIYLMNTFKNYAKPILQTRRRKNWIKCSTSGQWK